MVRKKGLGRGLDALIPQNIIETTSSDSIVNIELSKIIRREDQPRTHFEKDKIRELANSIKVRSNISDYRSKKGRKIRDYRRRKKVFGKLRGWFI